MPCMDGGPPAPSPPKVKTQQERYIDRMTQLLCRVVNSPSTMTVGKLLRSDNDLREWANKHAKEDDRRKKRAVDLKNEISELEEKIKARKKELVEVE